MLKRRIYTVLCGIILISMCMLAVSASVPAPVNIEQKTVGGTEYIVKTYNVNKSITAEMLIENDFESGGYLFAYTSSDRKENISEVSKSASKTASLETPTNNTASILKQFTSSMSYSEDGYFGTLNLDTASILTQASGYTVKNVPVYKTREYPGLMYNDPSAVTQSITDGGIVYTVSGIEWIVTGTALAGDSLVPTEYKAIASYTGSQRVTYATGYTTTAQYTGIVTKKTMESVTYVITYTGAFIPTTEPPTTTEEPTVEETTEKPEETAGETETQEITESGSADRLTVLLTAFLITAAVAAAALLSYKYYIKNNKKAKASVYNLIGEDYVLLGTDPLDAKNLAIDLNRYKDSIKSESFGFVLDNKSAEILNGGIITAAYNGETLSHQVKKEDKSVEYRFKLVFGDNPKQ